jgi:hypothetical protein
MLPLLGQKSELLLFCPQSEGSQNSDFCPYGSEKGPWYNENMRFPLRILVILSPILLLLLLLFSAYLFLSRCKQDEIDIVTYNLSRQSQHNRLSEALGKIFVGCRKRYLDAGKRCASDSECEGGCLSKCAKIDGEVVKGEGMCRPFDGASIDCYWDDLMAKCFCF